MVAYARPDAYVEESLSTYAEPTGTLAGTDTLTVEQADARYVPIGRPISLSIPLTSVPAFSVQVDSDATARLSITPDALIGFGSGADAADVTVQRLGPGTLGVGGALAVSNGAHITGDLDVSGTLSVGTLSVGTGGSLTALGWFNVRDYGAKGDGAADDRAAIQAAINAASAAGGGTVYIPVGTYLLGGTLSIPAGEGLQIIGSGWKSSLKVKDGANSYALTFPGADTRISVRDLTIDGNCTGQTAASGGIYGAGAVACHFEYLHFTACRDDALYLGPQAGGAFGHNNRIIGCLFDQSMAATGPGRGIHMDSSDENQVLGCDFEYLGGAGGSGATAAAMILDQAGTQFISDCNFVNGANNAVGVRVQDAKSTKIIGCNFDGLAGTAIFLAAQRCIVASNTIFSPGIAGTAGQASGIQLEYGTADNIITDNVITSAPAAGVSRGAVREAADGGSGRNNISLNTIVTDGAWSYGALDLSGTGSQVFGNIGGGAGSTLPGDLAASGHLIANVAGKGVRVKEGANATMGTVTLNGTTAVTIVNGSVTANTRIFLTIQTPGGTPASSYVSGRTPGTNFQVKSTGAGDTSIVAWLLVEPA
ncbi:glycosyl hydrolase family 28-related protein [Streptomyces sp. NPDC006265]|uniref:right-handed parallel beta-helix repeat-containing protein n=1 Tax=Streptomyces sp. NPDC006265 TaxID=3156740 RepID=UPI0033B5BC2F